MPVSYALCWHRLFDSRRSWFSFLQKRQAAYQKSSLVDVIMLGSPFTHIPLHTAKSKFSLVHMAQGWLTNRTTWKLRLCGIGNKPNLSAFNLSTFSFKEVFHSLFYKFEWSIHNSDLYFVVSDTGVLLGTGKFKSLKFTQRSIFYSQRGWTAFHFGLRP